MASKISTAQTNDKSIKTPLIRFETAARVRKDKVALAA